MSGPCEPSLPTVGFFESGLEIEAVATWVSGASRVCRSETGRPWRVRVLRCRRCRSAFEKHGGLGCDVPGRRSAARPRRRVGSGRGLGAFVQQAALPPEAWASLWKEKTARRLAGSPAAFCCRLLVRSSGAPVHHLLRSFDGDLQLRRRMSELRLPRLFGGLGMLDPGKRAKSDLPYFCFSAVIIEFCFSGRSTLDTKRAKSDLPYFWFGWL